MMTNEPTAAEITRRAKSNLAFALRCVPAERRAHLVTFYAYCRIIDDLADDLELPMEEKEGGLAGWKKIFKSGQPDESLGYPELQREVLEVRDSYEIPSEYFTNVIEGCQMDLKPQRFGRWEDLQEYTYRVASSVGLVCLPLFGADQERSREYAVTLGHALQLTNIIRDVGEDLENGVRIYLPLAEMGRFTYTERDLVGRVYDGRLLAYLDYQAQRAEELFQKAAELIPSDDFRSLLAPRIMHRIYHTLLQEMRADRFQIFEKRYRLSKPRKIFCLLSERYKKRP